MTPEVKQISNVIDGDTAWGTVRELQYRRKKTSVLLATHPDRSARKEIGGITLKRVYEDSNTQRAREIARQHRSTHGNLIQVVCMSAPKTIRLLYDDGFESVNDCNEGSFMQFGDMGTGSSCFWAFLDESGFHITYDEVIALRGPKKFSREGPVIAGSATDDGKWIDWEDGSQRTAFPAKKLTTKIFAEPGANAQHGRFDAFVWPSKPPVDCPFELSDTLSGIRFTGRHKEYTEADTWYPSWASDGNMYSPFADGNVGNVGVNSGFGRDARTGHAKIVGDDPMNLAITALGTWNSSALPYGGRYPCGSLVYNGIWYYGTYCLDTWQCNVDGVLFVWGSLEPFVGFRLSNNYGKTWVETPCEPWNPLFPEIGNMGAELKSLAQENRDWKTSDVRSLVPGLPQVKIGAPHFVDFGKNMENSPDGKAYLVAHGSLQPDASPRFANNSLCSGDQVYLLRVKPTPENINDSKRYEYFAGYDREGYALWTSDFAKIKPMVDWNNRCGPVTMIYNAPLKKYLMCITDGWPSTTDMNTYILESDYVCGPWKLVVFMEKFGQQAYFANIPSKFISSDGTTLWLCYSGNFTNDWLGTEYPLNPPGSRYGMCLQEVQLLQK